MTKHDSASESTLAAFKAAMDNGASRKVALDVALARMRAGDPSATQCELRSLLARALAAERANASDYEGDRGATTHARAPGEMVN